MFSQHTHRHDCGRDEHCLGRTDKHVMHVNDTPALHGNQYSIFVSNGLPYRL